MENKAILGLFENKPILKLASSPGDNIFLAELRISRPKNKVVLMKMTIR